LFYSDFQLIPYVTWGSRDATFHEMLLSPACITRWKARHTPAFSLRSLRSRAQSPLCAGLSKSTFTLRIITTKV